jgi:glycerophosphoryl diester phosphodiesterase
MPAIGMLVLSACSSGSVIHSTVPSHLRPGSTRSALPAGTTRNNPWLGRHVVAVTHNGGQFQFPQDTLFALHRAQALHMQVLDVDVQMSKDDVPVLIHSQTLGSSTSGHGDVSDYTAQQLAALDAAYQWVPGCGACRGRAPSAYPDRGVRTGARPLPPGASSRAEFGVPTLREVFEQFPQSYLDIELKPQSDVAPQVALLIHQFHRADRTIVASFDDQQIAQFNALAPAVATSPGQAASTSFFLGSPVPPGFEVLQLPYRYALEGKEVTVITPSLVHRAHAAGLAVWVWDEGAPPGRALYQRLVGLGVDGILASAPSDLLTVLHADHNEWAGPT